MKHKKQLRSLIHQMVREMMKEGFGGQLNKKELKKFESERSKNAEVLGYKLTGKKDHTLDEGMKRWKVFIKGESKPLILMGKDEKDVKKTAHMMIKNSSVKIKKVVKESILKEFDAKMQKNHFLNLIKKEIDSLKGQIAYAKDKVRYKGTPDWEKKEFKGVLKDLLKKLKDSEKHYKRVEKLKEDKEGKMAQGQLHRTIELASMLKKEFDINTDLPEWVESKITKAEDYLSTVFDYMRGKEGIGEGTLTESKQRYVVALDNGEVMSGDKSVTEKRALQIMSRIARQSDGWVNPFMLGVEYWNGTHPKRKGKPHKANKKKIMVKEVKLNEAIGKGMKWEDLKSGTSIEYTGGTTYVVTKIDKNKLQMSLKRRGKTGGGLFAGRAKLDKSQFESQVKVGLIKYLVNTNPKIKEGKLTEFGTDISHLDIGANSYIHPDRKQDVSNQGVYLQGYSNREAQKIIDGELRKWAKQLRKVEYSVIKDWMNAAKSGAIDFFDIIRGLKTGDIARAHPYETEFLVKLLTRDKVMNRFRSYFKGKKGKEQRRK